MKSERSENLTTNILKNKLMLHQRPIAHRTGKDDRYRHIAQENEDSSKYNNLFQNAELSELG